MPKVNKGNKFKRGQYVVYDNTSLYYIKGVRKSRKITSFYYYILQKVGKLTDKSWDMFQYPYTYVIDNHSKLATPTEILLYAETRKET